MHAHKVKVVIPEDHQITLRLPSDIPPGEAELIVLTGVAPEHEPAAKAAVDAAVEFETWLRAVLQRVPSSPVLPDEAFDRGSFYNE
jgi:hypothetical protein